MKKEKVLYICSNNHIPSLECSDWYKAFQSTLLKDVNMKKNKIETPYAIIDFVYRRPLFTWKYDFVFNADKQGDDAKLFAIALGNDY